MQNYEVFLGFLYNIHRAVTGVVSTELSGESLPILNTVQQATILL
jgi:hypothetical protein